MQTRFTPSQLSDPDLKDADAILRKCVHCGFCNATCPTFRILGDETDGPRGRIYLIKEMLENDLAPGAEVVRHLDRCLSCLSCMSTCPSGVNYMHLIDHGRAYVEARHKRPLAQRALRRILAGLLTRPRLVGAAAKLARPFCALTGVLPAFLRPALDLARAVPAKKPATPPSLSAQGERRGRVALLPGCVQRTLDNEINLASIRLLTRLGFDVSVLEETACCGAIEHHLGDKPAALNRIRQNLAAWSSHGAREPFDYILSNASGCGTMIKDYGYLLRSDPNWSRPAANFSTATRDVTEFLAEQPAPAPPPAGPADLLVACQVPCSMQHGQKIREQPAALLRAFGFRVVTPVDDGQCCGSAGTYNLLQPALARELGRRKAAALLACKADVVATGNLGCALQLRNYLDIPIVHTVQLLDWASGGPRPFRPQGTRARSNET